MVDDFRSARLTVVTIAIVLVSAFVSVGIMVYVQESRIDTVRTRLLDFNEPAVALAYETLLSLTQIQQQLELAIPERSDPSMPAAKPTIAYGDWYQLQRLVTDLSELHEQFGMTGFEVPISNLRNASDRLYEDMERQQTSANRDLSASAGLQRVALGALALGVSQLRRLHQGEIRQSRQILEEHSAFRSSALLPLAAAILLGALAVMAFLLRKNAAALEQLRESDIALRDTNETLENRVRLRTEELHISRETYRGLFENAPTAYFDVDLEGYTRRWNAAALEMLGLTAEQIDGAHVRGFVSEESLQQSLGILQRAGQGIPSLNEEIAYLSGDGSVRHCLLNVTPKLDPGGNTIGSLAMCVDITDLKAARARIEEMQQELLIKEKLATIGQMTATVSHELRNPLGACRSASEALDRLTDPAEPQTQRALSLLKRSLARCENVISELLEFTRARPLNCVQTDVGEWLAGRLEEFAFPKHIETTISLPSGHVADIDTARLEQAIRNIIDNAIQAMLTADTISGRIEISLHGEQRVELAIKDTGPGATAEVLDRMFEPLYSTKTSGVGLGLPLVKQIVEQHGGGIEAINRPEGGLEVRLWIPAAGSERPQSE